MPDCRGEMMPALRSRYSSSFLARGSPDSASFLMRDSLAVSAADSHMAKSAPSTKKSRNSNRARGRGKTDEDGSKLP